MVDIAAFDPGTTTGVATFTAGTFAFSSFELKLNTYPQPHKIMHDTLVALNPEKIVYETFHFRQAQLGAIFDGVEYIGVIRLYGQTNGIEIIAQSPGYGKSGFWDDRKLKKLGIHKPGNPHANDAMRHLLAYKAKIEPTFMEWVLSHFKGDVSAD